jgi:molybdate transport system regulatory protein
MSEISNLSIKLRLIHENEIAFGPGKAELLLTIISTGSISKAAKQMSMSYRRAWQLVDAMNRCFSSALVITQTGGSHGGGAVVTPLGLEILQLYQEMQQQALLAATPHYDELKSHLKSAP